MSYAAVYVPRCWPDGVIVWEKEDALGGWPKCTGTSHDSIDEGRKSFPSGEPHFLLDFDSLAWHLLAVAVSSWQGTGLTMPIGIPAEHTADSFCGSNALIAVLPQWHWQPSSRK
jgi:hypothetical protein